MDKEKIREQIGITLLAAIIFLSGYILFSQKTEPINFIAAKDSSNAVVSDSVPAPSNKTTAEAKGLVNINLGSIEDLDTLPGIGAVTAQKIVDHRVVNGPFKTKEAIMDVSGIGEAKYGQIQDLISI